MKAAGLLAMAVVALAGCAAPPPAALPPAAAPLPLAQTYAELGRGGGTVYPLDPATSTVRIYAFRAGAAARLGHDHVLSAPAFDGFAWMPATGVAGARFDLQLRLDQLEIDRPELRVALGGPYATPIPAEAIASTRQHLLGTDGFDAGRFPFVRIRTRAIRGEPPRCAVEVEVELHGATHAQWVPVALEGLPEKLVASGTFVLRQSDFGVKPYAVLGGALAVEDAVVIEFRLVSRS